MVSASFERVRPPREVVADLVGSERFEATVRTLAADAHRSLEEVRAEAVECLKEMTAGQSRAAVDAWSRLGRWMSRAYRVDAEVESLDRLRAMNATAPLVFLPNHRSYLDPLVLRSVLGGAGFPPNHVLGGVNLAFFPLGSIARRSNVVFIRREFKDAPVYRAMLGDYLAHLVSHGANLEWYIEGGRTRTGKLRPPRMGILSYLVDAFEQSGIDEVLFVPVSIIYDQQHEVGAIAAEESGGVKAAESVRWAVSYARAQGHRRGQAHVRFAEPVSLRQMLAESRSATGTADARQVVPKVAFEVCHRINQITPITAPALVAFSLLDTDGRALTEPEMRSSLMPVLEYIKARGLPVASDLHLDQLQILEERSPSVGVQALATLVREGVVTEFRGGIEPVFSVPAERQLEAAFYRNTLSHFFVTRSIVELALVKAAEDEAPDLSAAVWGESLRLRDLLKYEFFFSTKRDFDAEVRAEAELASPAWESSHMSSGEGFTSLQGARFLLAHRILAPFLEAYSVLADRLDAADPTVEIDADRLIAECVGVARQRVLQRSIRSPESVSKDLFRGALQLAGNRGLLEPGADDLAQRREQFAEELAEAVRRLGVIRALAAERSGA